MNKTDKSKSNNNVVGNKVTYGIRGLMEYMLLLRTAAGVLEIHFSGGQMTGYGIIPATFVTYDPILQRMIERTTEFKNKKIYIVNRV